MSPSTHVIYIDSITKLGTGNVAHLMYNNITNVMERTVGQISFGSVPGGDAWVLGTGGSGATKYNSVGNILHSGDLRVMTGGGGLTGSIVADGDVTGFRVSQSSDERLKKNISPITGGLDKVLKLQGVNYQFTNDRDNRREVGLIAQQVEEVVPEVVSEKEDGMKTVNYGALVSVLIEAVKELTQEVETLKAKLED